MVAIGWWLILCWAISLFGQAAGEGFQIFQWAVQIGAWVNDAMADSEQVIAIAISGEQM